MTLDDFKGMLINQRQEIMRQLEMRKQAIKDADAGMIVSINRGVVLQTIEIFDAKLDLISWILSQAEKIEMPKTKMREFL